MPEVKETSKQRFAEEYVNRWTDKCEVVEIHKLGFTFKQMETGKVYYKRWDEAVTAHYNWSGVKYQLVDEIACSFCGKSQFDVKRMFTASTKSTSAICNECIELCCEVLNQNAESVSINVTKM